MNACPITTPKGEESLRFPVYRGVIFIEESR